MPFSAQELGNIANAALDFYIKGAPLSSTIQDKPLLSFLKGAQTTFPGGKDFIKGNVKGDYTTTFAGYSHDDTVTYANPANMKQFAYPWKELHAGINVTYTELKKDGISVTGSDEDGTTEHSDREMTVISGIFEDKLEDMDEGMARSFNKMAWLDGTQDAKAFPGVQAIITQNPSVGIKAGIDCAQNRWWRNRARVGALAAEAGVSTIQSITGPIITSSVSLQTLSKTLRAEVRQLRRYGGTPDKLFCGSTFIDLLEREIAEKGIYTQAGFMNKGKNELGMAQITLNGLGDFNYDPTLDDLGQSDFLYIIDSKNLMLKVMEGEDMTQHSPDRPPEKYVLYRGVTWTGGLIARKLNSMGVYQAQ